MSASRLLAIVLGLLCLEANAWHEWVSFDRPSEGRFLSLHGDRTLRVGATVPDANERFTLIDENFGRLEDGDAVFVRMGTGLFLSVASNGIDVRADAPGPGSRQRFVLVVAPVPACTVVTARLGICDLQTVQLRHVDTGKCLGANVGDPGSEARMMDCADAAATMFRMTIHPEQPPLLSLSAPFTAPQAIAPPPIGVDHRHIHDNNAHNRTDCTHAQGVHGLGCYGGHEGTDFLLNGGKVAQNLGSMDVLAAAPGFVVNVASDYTDDCYYNLPHDEIRCPHRTDGNTGDHNNVVIVQDDGVIAQYIHLKRHSVVVGLHDRVECGTLLGKIGSSGHSATPHLHFDMARPFFEPRHACDGSGSAPPPFPAILPDQTDQNNPFVKFAALDAPGCPTGDRLDPYDAAISSPRHMLWFAVGVALIPKLACPTSDPHGKPQLPGGPGTPCRASLQCRPGLTCGSAGVCALPRDSGHACEANRDCAVGLRCDGQICTRPYGVLGQSCDAARHCSFGLDCIHDHCAVPPAQGRDGCPTGQRLRCPLDQGCTHHAGGCARWGRSGWASCSMECRY